MTEPTGFSSFQKIITLANEIYDEVRIHRQNAECDTLTDEAFQLVANHTGSADPELCEVLVMLIEHLEETIKALKIAEPYQVADIISSVKRICEAVVLYSRATSKTASGDQHNFSKSEIGYDPRTVLSRLNSIRKLKDGLIQARQLHQKQPGSVDIEDIDIYGEALLTKGTFHKIDRVALWSLIDNARVCLSADKQDPVFEYIPKALNVAIDATMRIERDLSGHLFRQAQLSRRCDELGIAA